MKETHSNTPRSQEEPDYGSQLLIEDASNYKGKLPLLSRRYKAEYVTMSSDVEDGIVLDMYPSEEGQR